MGTLPSKPIAAVVENVARLMGATCFVETGTWRGDTTRWAAARFARVESIEIDPASHKAALTALADLPQVKLHLGDSRDRLPAIVAGLSHPAVYWLDAHKGGGWFGTGDDCPLLAELDAINAGEQPALVLIDDARGFLAPPPPPFDWRAWPDLRAVLERACARPERFAIIVDDVILCVPLAFRDALREELHKVKKKL